MTSQPYDAVLLIGFGGPEKPEDVGPFMEEITEGRRIPPERLKQVARQYEKFDGVSPYNRLTFEQADTLQRLLKARGLDIPVSVGFAHHAPRVVDALVELPRQGKKRVFAIVMAPFRSPASYEKYVHKVDEALETIKSQGLPLPEVTYAPEWHNRPGFIQAISQRVQEAYALLFFDGETRPQTELIFTNHSLPLKMANESPYLQQFGETCKLVAAKLGLSNYQTAFTSRTGRPEDPWLEPDLTDYIDHRPAGSPPACVVAPIGFLVDHMEVLYDIDVLAAEKAKRKGLRMVRAKTVGSHPSFIAMLASLIEEAI